MQLDKPLLGQPCNGCGLCCILVVCDLGRELGDADVCRALLQQPEGRFACGLVLEPYRFMGEESLARWRRIDALGGDGQAVLREMYARALGAGRGCDSDDAAVVEGLEQIRLTRT